jgi:hypothetical protein
VRRLSLVPVAALIACVGDIRVPTEQTNPPPKGPSAAACGLPSRLVRLSTRHYRNAVRDLLGLADGPLLTAGGGDVTAFFPLDAPSVSDAMALEYNDVADAMAAQVDVATLAPCPALRPRGLRGCAADFIARFVPRAFRRPLVDGEAAALLNVYDAGEGYDDGVRMIISAVLQSPSFVYRTELHAQLDDYEAATQLSFFLLDSQPDDELWAAAERGELSTHEGRRAQVDRLMQLPRVRDNVTQILLRWFRTDRVTQTHHDDPAFTGDLTASMAMSTQLFVDDVLWNQNGSLNALMTSRDVWVDSNLAGFLGVPAPQAGGFAPATFPADQRAGLLTQPSLMASLAGVSDTSIVRRGLFVYSSLLCLQPQPPPPGVVAAAAADLAQLTTQRQLSDYRRTHQPCGSCHGSFDPFGITLENYDALGAYRSTMPDGTPVDAAWNISFSPTLQGAVNGGAQLAQLLAASPDVARCVARQLASYQAGAFLSPDLACLVDAAPAEPQPDVNLVDLIARTAASGAFQTRVGAP